MRPAVMSAALTLAATLSTSSSWAVQQQPRDPVERLRQAEIQELVQSDGDGAASAYAELATDATVPRAVRIQAAHRLALLERRRGNLRRARQELERVVELADAGNPFAEQATRLLEQLRGDAGNLGLHDWHRTLSENPAIRAELLQRVTDLASANDDVRGEALISLRAHGTLALPVIRGALRAAEGAYRRALVQAAVEAGDWSYLGELAEFHGSSSFGDFVVQVADWDRERQARFLKFLDQEASAGTDAIPSTARVWLELAAGRAPVSEIALSLPESAVMQLAKYARIAQALRAVSPGPRRCRRGVRHW